MEVVTPIPRQPVGRTFTVAIGVLGLVLALQIGGILWLFWKGYRAQPSAARELDGPLPDAFPEQATPETALVVSDNFAEPDAPTPDPGAVARPTPIPNTARSAAGPEARIIEAVQQARGLRERGDTGTAMLRLREALAASPTSPLVISEIAITFEKLGQAEKAAEQWRRIFDMGEAAGIYYSAAEAKLRVAQNAAAGAAAPGVQPGSVLGLMDISRREIRDPEAAARFALSIPIKARAGEQIDVRDAVIQVYFYDTVNGTDIVQTNANVSSSWSTLPANWSDDDIEVLEVEYAQPKAADAEAADTRKFHGYVVRVYYRNELQDMRADPVALLKKFPPPLTLQPE